MLKKGVKLLVSIVGLGIILLLLIQLVPYGRDHTNPPAVQEPNWDSQQTRALALRACYDCHSNETTWPWYSSVAPVSWLVYRDVVEGRRRMNFSDWQNSHLEGRGEITEVILEGEMPPLQYLLLHPNARLSASEKDQFASGISSTISR
jgi:hypothetical protein